MDLKIHLWLDGYFPPSFLPPSPSNPMGSEISVVTVGRRIGTGSNNTQAENSREPNHRNLAQEEIFDSMEFKLLAILVRGLNSEKLSNILNISQLVRNRVVVVL